MSHNARICIRGLIAALGMCLIWTAPALAIPEGRVYEMVSPPYKGGYDVASIEAVAPNGESVVYGSRGAFAGDPNNQATDKVYLAKRTASEWVTTPLDPPSTFVPRGGVLDYSPTLEWTLDEGDPGPDYGYSAYADQELDFLLHDTALPDTAAAFEVAGEPLLPVVPGTFPNASDQGASPDFSHVVLEAPSVDPLLPEAEKTRSLLYDLASHPGEGEAALQLVGLDNRGDVLQQPACEPKLGSLKSALNAVAADGREIFFQMTNEDGCDSQLFVRIDASRTVEVSRPLEAGKPYGGCGDGGKVGEVPGEVPCPGAAARAQAEFQGASEDGSAVFFTTEAPLTEEGLAGCGLICAQPKGNNLYMARIGCPAGAPECAFSEREVTALVDVSSDPHGGEAADVQGVVTMAQDGSRVYFVARGALAEGANAEGAQPLAGADNLYVYDSASGGAPVFIADLCSGPGLSGVVEDVHCPTSLSAEVSNVAANDDALWRSGDPEAQLNTCSRAAPECVGALESGRFLVFSSYGQLTRDDTDTTKDVYRYDAQSGVLERVSGGENGYDANGNDDVFNASIAGYDKSTNATNAKVAAEFALNSRAVSEDGTRIVFSSAGPLSPAAVSGLPNVYEWHREPGWSAGRVALVSNGSAAAGPVEEAVISANGTDIFFTTSLGLVPQDTDGQYDLYDARLGGGFPTPAEPAQRCAGDACYGPLSNPAPLLVPGSVSQQPGEEFAAPAKAAIKSAPVKAKRKTKKKAKKQAKKGKSKASKAARKGARRASVRRGGRSGR